MKSKFSVVILILFSLLLIIFTFNNDKINDVTLSLAATLSKNNYNLVYNILHYFELIVFYGGFSIVLTIVCIEYFASFKYILIYSILLNMLAVVIVLIIKSIIGSIDYYDLLVSIISILFGVSFEILLKIKQIKGEKNEE